MTAPRSPDELPIVVMTIPTTRENLLRESVILPTNNFPVATVPWTSPCSHIDLITVLASSSVIGGDGIRYLGEARAEDDTLGVGAKAEDETLGVRTLFGGATKVDDETFGGGGGGNDDNEILDSIGYFLLEIFFRDIFSDSYRDL